jgi:hypothetical protein
MRRTSLLMSIVFAAPLALAGCPDRGDSIDPVGGAAGRQMEVVRGKVDKVEDKLDQRAADATKSAE